MSSPKDISPNQFAGQRLRFATFEVDLEQRELRNRGIRVHLQRQPFQILELLLRKPGALVTRKELTQHLWPGLHVSFGHGLNTAINVLRQALGDSSGPCRLIETRPGFGYRFLANVEVVPEPERGLETNVSETGPVTTNHKYKTEAYRDYRKGKYLQSKVTETDLGKSIAHFESAIAQDPGLAPAYAGLAATYSQFACLGLLSSAEARSKAEELIQVALNIDHKTPEAHVALAEIRMIFDWDYPAAEAAYQRALDLSPSSVDAHGSYAAFLSAMGRSAEAFDEIRTARDLDPLSPVLNIELARVHFLSGEFQECINQVWETLILDANYAPAQHLLGMAYEQVEMYEEALIELENARGVAGDDPAIIASLGHAYGRIGQTDKSEDALRKLDDLSQRRSVSHYWRSIVYAGQKVPDLALEALENACEEHAVCLMWLKVEPRFAILRADRRFDRLLEAVGLKQE